jgi:hypothetical protein
MLEPVPKEDEVVGVGGGEERKGAWKLEKAPMPEIGQL